MLLDWKSKKYTLEDVLLAISQTGVNGSAVSLCQFLGMQLWEVDSEDEPTSNLTREGEEIQVRLDQLKKKRLAEIKRYNEKAS